MVMYSATEDLEVATAEYAEEGFRARGRGSGIFTGLICFVAWVVIPVGGWLAVFGIISRVV